MSLSSAEANFQERTKLWALGWQHPWQLGKECLWRSGWYSTTVITVHLLCYSDPHASYKNPPHQGRSFPRFWFVSLPGELKRGSWVTWTTASCHWISLQDTLHTHFYSCITQFRFSSPSTSISASLGGLFDRMTQTHQWKIEAPSHHAFLRPCLATVFHLLIKLGRRVKKTDAPVNHLNVQVFFSPPPFWNSSLTSSLWLESVHPDMVVPLPCLFVS